MSERSGETDEVRADLQPLAIRDLVAHAAHFLPSQGPITAFVHHNTLHAFEDLPFEDAVEKAAALYGCEPYLSEERYRAELERGAIRASDLEAVVRGELGRRADETIAGLVSRVDLWSAMLLNPVRLATDAEVQWVVAAGDGVRSFRRRCPPLTRERLVADTRRWVMRDLRGGRESAERLRRMSADVLSRWGEARIERWRRPVWEEVTLTLLWRLCRAGAHGLAGARPPAPAARLRDELHAAAGVDPDALVHETLIRFCAAFADQGLAGWHLPRRDEGFFRSFLALCGKGFPLREPWLRRLPDEAARLEREETTPEQSIEESLAAFGIGAEARETFVTQSLLALRGWAGMLWQLESRPDRVRFAAPPGTLVEFLAVRLVLDRLAAENVARDVLRRPEPLDRLGRALAVHRRGAPGRAADMTATQRGYVIFLLAQSLGWSPRQLSELAKEQWGDLVREIEAFPGLTRRKLFHRAYEYRYRVEFLDALSSASLGKPGGGGQQRPLGGRGERLQVICCIDEREESLRRHLEELDPACETFGAAGFFGVAMYYRGTGDVHEMPLCPVAIRPAHRVCEAVAAGDSARFARGEYWTRRIGLAAHGVRAGSLGLLGGLPMALLGSAAAAPLVSNVLFPRLSSRLRRKAGGLVKAPIRTELLIERDPGAVADTDGIHDGFVPEEMAAIVERLLRDIGLTRDFARLVVVIGHGSSSLNNPHEAAHDCGACGGGRGGPNARAFALMANHPEVRARLAAGGLMIPEDTVFLGAYHDTCDDSVVVYDTDLVPPSHEDDCRRARETLAGACGRNAHERCRRFRSASLLISPEGARRHVEARSEDLAQPRPEFGHATNAVCVVGRRARTRGLFMDRRAFLVSYDPSADAADPSSPILERILAAVVPVCAGINLEYYFSYVDPTGWGCGTKLPHNITSLLGVMDGFASDLRPGLPWQMVEIHDPVRLTMVVETTPDRLSAVLERNEAIGRLCRNGWIHLATLDPSSARVHLLAGGELRPHEPGETSLPEAPSSARWYGGLREHLEFAVIRPEGQEGTEEAEKP